MLPAVFIALFAGCDSSDPVQPAPPVDPSLSGQIHRLVEVHGIPGAAGVAVTHESIVDIRAAGVRCAGSDSAVAAGDLFHIGSIGKSMTATMIASLVEGGALSWSAGPADFIPGLADSIHPLYRDITLLDLLRHRAGVPADEDIGAVPIFAGTLAEQRLQASRWVLKLPPAATPGTFRYSNAGYVIAAAVAESATGTGWRALMDSLLFEPLAMEVHYGWPREHDDDQPCGHEPAGASYRPVDPSVEPASIKFLEPAGFISMSVSDLAEFVELHLAARLGRPSILTQASFDTLHAPVGGYACGLGVARTYDGTLFWHNGSNDYFYAVMYFLPAGDAGVAVAVNAGGAAAGTRTHRAAETVLKAIIE
ncbi:MAG: serine hydrolase [Candidatus Krumholzibacteria bacterium]|nr:serine hydrolase [Candidatus Krumholzibacteria bacterium]